MHGKQKKMRGGGLKRRGGFENVFEFYALLAMHFSPRKEGDEGREARL